MSDDNDKPLGAELDMTKWEAQSPPADFAERVLAKVREAEPRLVAVSRKPRQHVWLGAGVAAVLTLAAAIAIKVSVAPPSRGEATAESRTEVAIGSRAIAVLEPGAHVQWDGDEVQQPNGDVFYRVEKGAKFRVHTPAGDVEVKGTCFTVKVSDMQKRDLKSGAVGAALSALAFVGVYEGKVAVSHAGERVELGAGETAQAGASGVHRSGDLGAGQKEFDDQRAAVAEAESVANANENLVAQVSEYRKRLETIAQQKGELEDKLKKSEDKLASLDASAPKGPKKNEFDLSADDWKELAKDGTMKMAIPCRHLNDWHPSADTLAKLGLAPQDESTLRGAFKKSNDRVWSTIRPLCAQMLGSPEVADKVGEMSCEHVILELSQRKDRETANEVMREVAEVRAGLRPMPGPNDPIGQTPLFKMFVALTSEMGSFESDLAQQFGPDEAHRLAYADDMCMGHSTWGGPGPRQPATK